MVKITCTSCQKPLSIDETKLPMKEVSFPCPSCKTKLKIDRRTLPGAAGAGGEAPSAPSPAAAEDEGFGEKALVIGNDSPQVRQALKAIGRQMVHFASADAAREFFLQEYPSVVVFSSQQIGPPPVAEMAPLLQITPGDRRKSFFVLIADNLRSLDGNAAFLYNVNLVVASKDLGSFPQIFRDADIYHQRLYVNINAFA
jgi:hypothetical protein